MRRQHTGTSIFSISNKNQQNRARLYKAGRGFDICVFFVL